jgi:hypothetical protein
MAKKKKGGKAKGGGGKAEPVKVIQPEPEELTLLYRKARFDVQHPLKGELRVQFDKNHRAAVGGYCQFLRERNFWMAGDEIPGGRYSH